MTAAARIKEISAEQFTLGKIHLDDVLQQARCLAAAASAATQFPDTALKGGIRSEMRNLAQSLAQHIATLEKISCSN